MAHNAPPSQDVQDIQFKLHDKFTIFPEGKDLKSLVSLLAVSSAKGILFAGNPNAKELKVFKLRDVVDAKNTGQDLRVRVVALPGEPKALSCSCDGSMLAINYVFNNTGFIQIVQVDSFVTTNLNVLYNMPIAPESNVFALQLLWNPVIPNNIALILTDGSVMILNLNPGGQYDKVTLAKENQVKSGCWSPKGKQIVFGFADGKLQQFKPNLQPARAIPCPAGLLQGPFDCIAVHWLSTFQFAAIFLQRGQDMSPTLFIVNAPKAGQPSYINYFDICYSAPGPRIHQLSFNHIPQWNLLLVTSANGVEVGILGTRETGETPNWIQYTLLDEARIEMPLTDSKDETYPLGFAYDTASSHQVAIGENRLPVMPMIHVLSTHGHLVSFNFLNLSPNAVDVCSPPPPLNDNSGQFISIKETLGGGGGGGQGQSAENQNRPSINANANAAIGGMAPSTAQGFTDTTFSVGSNMVTSTPSIKDKPVPLFGAQATAAKPGTGFGFPSNTAVTAAPAAGTATKPSTGFGFGGAPTTAAAPAAPPPTATPFSQPYGNITTGTTFGGFAATGFGETKPKEPPVQAPQLNQAPVSSTQPLNVNKNPEQNKPLYTVPSTFTPPPVQQTLKQEARPLKSSSSTKLNLNTGEIDEVVKQMIVIQMEAFEAELKQIQNQSKQLMENIGSPNEIKSYSKQLNDLQEIIEQADDHEFEQDVQSLRHSMNESYAMLAESRTKLDLYNNPNLTRLSTVSNADPINRRQLSKLQAYCASNQTQLSQLNQLIDAQWSQYQDVVRRNSKNQMHIPCLDGVYQRMSKLKDLLSRQRTKMNYIKSKLKQKGLNYKPSNDLDVISMAVGAVNKNQSTMESLADSILSMSLSQVVSQTHAKLSEDKLNAIREFTRRQQQITIIKPKRPDRVGLKSEVILETKLQTERKQKEMAKQQQQQQQLQQQQYQAQPFKGPQQTMAFSKVQQQDAYRQQSMQQQQIHKPQATMQTSQQQQQQQPILAKPTASKPSMASQPPKFITPTSATPGTLTFGGNSSFVKTSNSSMKSDDTLKSIGASTPFQQFGMSQSPAALSFGQPKPMTSAVPTESTKENLPTNTPISFSAKVIGGNDAAKPFANLANKPSTPNIMGSQGFAPPTSVNQGFTPFTPTIPTNQDKDPRKSEDAPKPFAFAPSSAASSAGPTTAFGGFATKPPGAVSTSSSEGFTTSLFSGGSNAATSSTPFANLTASVSTPFAAAPYSFNTISTASSTTPAVASTTANKTIATPAIPLPATSTAAAATTKSVETKAATSSAASTTATPATSTPASFSFNSSANSFAAPNVTITTSSVIPEPKQAAATTSTNPPTSTASSDPTDSLFGSLNICKPNTKDSGDSAKAANVFSGFGAATSAGNTTGAFSFASASGAGDGAKSFLSSTATTGTTPSSGFSFGDTTSASSAANIFGNTAAPTATGAVSTATTTNASNSATSAVESSTTTTAAAPTSTSSFSFAGTPSTTAPAGSVFGAQSLSSAATTPATNATSKTAPDNVFGGGGSSVFGQASTASMVAATTSTTTSIFGSAAATATTTPSVFGTTAPAATSAATPSSASVFGNTAAVSTPQTTGSIFGGIPKPDQSVFGVTSNVPQPAGTGIFAAAAATTKPPATTGASIFGGGSTTGFGAPTGASGGSLFGGSNAAAAASSPFGSPAPANTSGSIFAAAAAATKPVEGGNIFGSPTQQSAASGGSIFGKTTFGQAAPIQSSGGIFGAAAAQSPTAGGFGSSGGSIFGGSSSANNSASGGSIFGGAAAAPAFGSTAPSTTFGAFSQPSSAPAFGSPNASGFGAPASAGFGSPQQQSAFAKPVFGGPATFGTSPQPAFGAQPTFGGAPTFGSPKGFGSFAATSPTAATGFGANTAAVSKGNIFETMGSQDSGLTFGNLAHSTQPPQQKPSFGGSSFTSYRS